MAFEPINIFSSRIDPAGVVRLVRNIAPDARVTGGDEDWTRIEVEVGDRTLVIGHERAYYAGADWPNQRAGMQGYFGGFPDAPSKLEALRLVRSFKFALSFPVDDLDLEGQDPRLRLVKRICRYLDGVIFTPSALRDADGRLLFDRSGVGAAPDAMWPGFPAELSITGMRYDEPDPPDPRRVAERALALTAVVARASIEREAADGELDDPDVTHAELIEWVELGGFAGELESAERDLLHTPVGALPRRSMVHGVWRAEGLAVLAWALDRHPLPPYDQLVHLSEIFSAMSVLDAEGAQRIVAQARVPTTEVLEARQAQILAFHWRMREFSLRPAPMDFVAYSRDCWFGGFDVGEFELVDGDLALGGVALAAASLDAVESARSAAHERHVAINWLLGESEVYSKTDTST